MSTKKTPLFALKYKIGIALAAVLGITGSVIYSIAYSNFYDKKSMHYTSTPALYIFGILICASLLAALLTACVLRKNLARTPSEIKMSVASKFFRIAAGLVFAVFFVYSLVKGHWNVYTSFGRTLIVLSPFASASMIAGATSLRKKWPEILLSLIPVIWTGVLIFGYYFSRQSMPINSPEKSLTNVVIAALLLFLLSESRDSLDDVNPVLCIFSTASATFVAGTVSIARIILRLTCRLNHPTLKINVIFLAISLYAAARLLDVLDALRERPAVVIDRLMNGDGEELPAPPSGNDDTELAAEEVEDAIEEAEETVGEAKEAAEEVKEATSDAIPDEENE